MESNEEQFLSLYDFLGKPAGGDLGKAVHAEAKRVKQPIRNRDVKTKKYEGKVLLYKKEFLETYFKK